MNKAMLIILDGFGHSTETEHNAIYKANTPFIDSLYKKYPNSLIETSGEAVGLPDGVMGNSEVGHLTLGSGRVIYQDLSKITNYANADKFLTNKHIEEIAKTDADLHLMGLLSDGGVHSHISHLFKLLDAFSELNPNKKINIHCIMDGRDTAPTSGITYLEQLEAKISSMHNICISTISGRFYTMDRDKRWDRVEKAYNCLTGTAEIKEFDNAIEAITVAYENETDEFITPCKMKDGDFISNSSELIFFNFRADRAREISMALSVPSFKEFETEVKVSEKKYYTFTKYQEDFKFPVLFPKESLNNILGEIVAQNNAKQLRIAETEKYAHVTYFFNGGREEIFDGEDRILVDSPKDVETYDLKPEMSAPEVSAKLVEAINSEKYKMIVCNYANGDMVGHTGVEPAAIKAVECLDKCLKDVITAALAKSYEVLITADHGNCEQMINPETGKAFTQHTTNQVPLFWVGKKAEKSTLSSGGLADIAPTMLYLLGLNKASDMSGKNLVSEG